MGTFLPSGSLSVPVFRLATRVFIVTRRTYPKSYLRLPLFFLYHISICGSLFPPTELAERGPPVSSATQNTPHLSRFKYPWIVGSRHFREPENERGGGGLGYSFRMTMVTMLTKMRKIGTETWENRQEIHQTQPTKSRKSRISLDQHGSAYMHARGTPSAYMYARGTGINMRQEMKHQHSKAQKHHHTKQPQALQSIQGPGHKWVKLW